MIFALVGNQNCGKTTLFNALTGSNQHVGNFPGVTVDQKMGQMRDEKGCSVVDLPGIYSVTPASNSGEDERVARDYILSGEAGHETINLLEINTTPGMTATSFIPQQVRAAGLEMKDVLADIIEGKLNADD